MHLKTFHPEMRGQLNKIKKTLLTPERLIRSQSDEQVQLYYHFYKVSPVGAKYLCVVVKSLDNDYFILTAYFTDTIKRGELLWTKTNI